MKTLNFSEDCSICLCNGGITRWEYPGNKTNTGSTTHVHVSPLDFRLVVHSKESRFPLVSKCNSPEKLYHFEYGILYVVWREKVNEVVVNSLAQNDFY